MTSANLRRLSPADLWALYVRLSATVVPQGRFQGHAWSETLPIETLAGWLWQGKVFTGNTVKNLMLGRELIAGDVSRELHGFGPTYEV